MQSIIAVAAVEPGWQRNSVIHSEIIIPFEAEADEAAAAELAELEALAASQDADPEPAEDSPSAGGGEPDAEDAGEPR